MISSFQQVGVIGSGAMGSGIAQVAAMAGHVVVLYDTNANALEKAKTSLSQTLFKLQEKGKIENATAIIDKISYSDKLTSLSSCKLIIEAIVEKLEIKKSVFAEVE